MSASIAAFNVLETTIDDIHSAYKSGQLLNDRWTLQGHSRVVVQPELELCANWVAANPR